MRETSLSDTYCVSIVQQTGLTAESSVVFQVRCMDEVETLLKREKN
jgi:hypothetical protein